MVTLMARAHLLDDVFHDAEPALVRIQIEVR